MCANIIEERGISGDPQWFYFSPVPSNSNREEARLNFQSRVSTGIRTFPWLATCIILSPFRSVIETDSVTVLLQDSSRVKQLFNNGVHHIFSIHFYVSITKDLQRDTRDGWQLWHDDLKAVSRKSLALHYQLCQNMGASLLCHFSEPNSNVWPYHILQRMRIINSLQPAKVVHSIALE